MAGRLVSLRPVAPGDLDFMTRLFGDPRVMQHIGEAVATWQEAQRKLILKAGTFALYGYGNWVVCDRDSGAPLGEFGFFDAGRGAEYGLPDGIEAGWSFLPEIWGRGIASDAVAAAHGWFDRKFPGRTSLVIISQANPASRRVAEKSGYGAARQVDFEGRPNTVLVRRALSTAAGLG